MEEAVRSFNAEQSLGVDNVPSERIKHWGDVMKAALCQQIREEKKTGNLKLCHNNAPSASF
ncbi:hypothetical protein DPMN_143569 [Dreissena polymorpha]|uniref:Uncharacterized protein n=1 Tax=Dreissena polymorpha TaxID=45954 RepID=A0A9D4GDC6_DREPO|nr:hypothetical protein DPMN_143569 [Dreissena polymorpha]